ncbi:MAG: lytic transglycosylase domain-containing protein [Pseudomonadota bacterium]
MAPTTETTKRHLYRCVSPFGALLCLIAMAIPSLGMALPLSSQHAVGGLSKDRSLLQKVSSSVPSVNAQALSNHRGVLNRSTRPLKDFFHHLGQKDVGQAISALNRLNHPVDRAIASHALALSPIRSLTYQHLLSAQRNVANWPGQITMALRQENALVRSNRVTRNTAGALPATPNTDDGKILQVRSLIIRGESTKARDTMRSYWHGGVFGKDDEALVLKEFGSFISEADHIARVDGQLYRDEAMAALRIVPKLPHPEQLLAMARIAVIQRRKDAGDHLREVPDALHMRPGYFYAVVQYLRRNDQWMKAGEVLNVAPRDPAALVNLRSWWKERRLVSRKVLEGGNAKLALQLVSAFQGGRAVDQADAAFHAGWYALRFLNDPERAKTHFGKLETIATRPLSQSRAHYWLGRAHQAAGSVESANNHFIQAAQHPTTYYGQLALRSLGHSSVGLPQISDGRRAQGSFDANLFVTIIRRLEMVGQRHRTPVFYRHLARTFSNEGEIILLARLAEDNGLHNVALQVGKTAVGRGFKVDRLAFPLKAIPESVGLKGREKALAYAVSRQESAFQIDAVSRADARGLMQLLPGTASQVARQIGVRYEKAKLTRDPAFNVTLGTTFLGGLINRFQGSYVLAFAAYNAGPRRSDQWIERFGDPRLNAIDAVDWVEAIPFAETRNYVQRVMEGYQVYRHRLEGARLTIFEDLNRGRGS